MDPTQAASFEARLDAVVDAVDEIRQSINRLADAYTRLAVLEERQASGKEEMSRAWREIENLRTQVAALKEAAPINAQTTTWVNKVIGLLIAAAVSAALTLGLTRPSHRDAPPVQIEGKR